MEGSFSWRARSEALDNFKFSKSDKKNRAFLRGFFFRNDPSASAAPYACRTDMEKAARAVRKLLKRYKVKREVEQAGPGGAFDLVISDPESLQSYSDLQKENPLETDTLATFLTGLFVYSGIVTDPVKSYDLEFAFDEPEQARVARAYLKEAGFPMRRIRRQDRHVLYTKSSSMIEDFLATVGASNSFLVLMGDKVVKDIRNRSNRITNCETANIAKTVRAASKQTESIEALIASERIYALPDDMQALAQLRIENPERSLAELGRMLDPPLTKSSVNRRMEKLLRFARTGSEDTGE